MSQYGTSNYGMSLMLAIILNISLTKTMRNRNLISIAAKQKNSFRQQINPSILVVEAEAEKTKWWTKEDTHLFALSFTAFFVVFYTFIA